MLLCTHAYARMHRSVRAYEYVSVYARPRVRISCVRVYEIVRVRERTYTRERTRARARIGVARNATGVAAMRFRSSTRSVPCVPCRDGSGMVGSSGWWW